MGYLEDEDLLARAPLRVFLDIDPGFGQMWRELGPCRPLRGPRPFRDGRPRPRRCGLRCSRLRLRLDPTLPPVVLDQWPKAPGGRSFTSVATWRGPYDPIEYEGRTYGLRVHEFRRFLSLPQRVPGRPTSSPSTSTPGTPPT